MTPVDLHRLTGFRPMAAGAELRLLPAGKAEALIAHLALPPSHAHRRDKGDGEPATQKPAGARGP